jgi:hypothetical protein
MANSTLGIGLKQVVHQDMQTIRRLLTHIRRDERFADLSLFKRRSPDQLERQDERRSRDRSPLCWPIQVMPVNFENGFIDYVDCPLGEIHVYSQDVTLRGISFLYTEPLQTSHAVISVDLTDTESLSLLLEVCWTATGWDQPFLGCGKFLMSGGRFLGIVELPEIPGT